MSSTSLVQITKSHCSVQPIPIGTMRFTAQLSVQIITSA
ncbi:Uncharacterised protein [Segatella copri]|nr:Uncharacterised protein [Segatella copri]